MKRILTTLLLLVTTMLVIFAQNVIQKEVYTYRAAYALNEENEIIDTFSKVEGIIVFSSAGGNDYFSLTVGDQILYNGIIARVKEGARGDDFNSVVYLVIQEHEGYKVPIQVFKVYDTSYSNYIPNMFLVQVLNRTTNKVETSLQFSQIARSK